MKLILDIETTRQVNPITDRDDPSPYNPKNKIVTVQYKIIETGKKECLIFHHSLTMHDEWDKDWLTKNSKELQELLDKAELVIGHNLKFDMSWLYETGFKYDGEFHDTMIFEYVCAKGMKQPMGLADIAIKYGLPKKLDILQEYWEKGVNTDEVPLAELTEYGLQDIETTAALYNLQIQKVKEDSDVKFMQPAIKLTNEALKVIIEMERNGCSIDLNALNEVEKEYLEELEQLERGIGLMVGELMGDTPINLASPDDMSKLLYGFEFKDKEAKKKWTAELGIGTDERNSVKKKRQPKWLKEKPFRVLKKDCLQTLYKTHAEQCATCKGTGKIFKIKKDGTQYKKQNICPDCEGKRFKYISSRNRAGLKLRPLGTKYTTVAGFAADKKVIEIYLNDETIDEEAKAFLKALQRQSSITSYLSTFVEGIRNNVREDLLLHTSLNQCITATGRLSSSNPNFQNLPRGSTFPVRRAIKSRFEDGWILEVDFAGLEYVTAVMLSECPVGLESILSGKDRHQVSAEIIFGKPKSDYEPSVWKQVRQAAKSHTFKPLYGGQTGTEAEQRYYKAFLDEHTGIAKWHEKLCDAAIRDKQIKTPTARIFAFQNCYRQHNGRVRGKTQIVNYPVQSVATADIIWIVLVDIFNEMRSREVKSKLILQVHDAVVLDVHPEEKDLMIKIVKKSFDRVHELLYNRYVYKTPVPIKSEMSIGVNWKDKTEIAA